MAGPLLFEAGVVFAVLAVGAALAGRLDQSVVPAYLLAGVLVGPNAPAVGGVSLALVETREFLTLLAEFGVVFLLFFIGLEFNLERLLAAPERTLRAGTIDLANGVVGFLAGVALGFSGYESLFLAGVVYISSSAVVTKTLVDLGWVADPESEAVLGVLVFEDVVVAVYLAVLTAVALGGEGAALLGSLGRSLAFILALVLLAHYGTGLLERALDVRAEELFVLRVVAGTVLLGGVALALDVSEAVAAFFLGAAVGATSHAERIERVIASERDLFAAVFFLSIGLSTDPRVVATVLGPVAALVAATSASKLATGYLGGRAYGLSPRRSTRVGVSLVARGEFSLVVAALAATAGATPALRETVPAVAVGYVLVTSLLGTTLMRYTEALEALAATRAGT